MCHPAPASGTASSISRGGSVRALTPRPLPPYTAIIDGHLLRQLRRQHGLSLENLAWKAGVGLTTLGRLEREARPRCRTWTLVSLARELGEDPATIAVLVRLGKNEPPCAPQPRQPGQPDGPRPNPGERAGSRSPADPAD
jgi:DNA-binding XRE family transcriptional regulator